MLGFTPHISGTNDIMTVAIPPPILVLVLFLIPLPILVGAYRRTHTLKGRRAAIIALVVNVAILGAIFTPGRVVLDAKAGKASISGMFMFIPHHREIPLSLVEGATVRTAELTGALVLVQTDGRTEQLMPYTQMWGLDEAATAINSFLAAHRGANGPNQGSS